MMNKKEFILVMIGFVFLFGIGLVDADKFRRADFSQKDFYSGLENRAAAISALENLDYELWFDIVTSKECLPGFSHILDEDDFVEFAHKFNKIKKRDIHTLTELKPNFDIHTHNGIRIAKFQNQNFQISYDMWTKSFKRPVALYWWEENDFFEGRRFIK